jgi:ABC-type nickel/cobalt efflux system permease component RcnA
VRILKRLLLAGGVIVGGLGASVLAAGPASAHPLGNFTVNRYARLEVSGGTVRVYYVLDEAELPAFEDRGAVAANRVGFAHQRAGEILSNLRLTVDGTPLRLSLANVELSQPAGQGGLTTLRLAILFAGGLPPGSPDAPRLAEFRDGNEPGRIGWREIVVLARGDAHLISSTAPQRDLSDELHHYPGNLIQAPLDLRSATFRFTPGAVAVPALPIATATKAVTRYGGQFTSLITKQHLSVLVLLGMFAVALGFGAVHALAPGHGKTVMAAYLVGTRGRPRDAVLLGAIVSFMHTASVLVLGAVLFQVSRRVAPDQVYPWLKLASGAAIAVYGAALVVARRRAWRRQTVTPTRVQLAPAVVVEPPVARQRVLVGAGGPALPQRSGGHEYGDDHRHGPGGYGRDHGHDHGRGHDHHRDDDHHHGHHHGDDHHHGPGGHVHELPEGVPPLSRRGLVVLATAGGLFPSPSALIVLIAAFTLGRVVLGLALIAAFSVGLAVTLTGVGLALVYGRAVAERRGVLRTVRVLPLASAAVIFVLGVVFALNGIRSLHRLGLH